jgi:hypothetical protein
MTNRKRKFDKNISYKVGRGLKYKHLLACIVAGLLFFHTLFKLFPVVEIRLK